MDRERAQSFAEKWVAAWNRHDLDSLLEHFAQDAVFTSPVAASIVEGSNGVIRGRSALHAYWSEGVRRIPELRFEVVGVYVGIDIVVINFRNQDGNMANEVLRFDGPLVVEGHGTYL